MAVSAPRRRRGCVPCQCDRLACAFDDEGAAGRVDEPARQDFWYSGELYQRFTAALSANSRMITRFDSGPPLNSSVAATDALNPRDRGFEFGFLQQRVMRT